MSFAIKSLWVLLGIGLLVGTIALTTWGIPAPTAEVTVVLAKDKKSSQS